MGIWGKPRLLAWPALSSSQLQWALPDSVLTLPSLGLRGPDMLMDLAGLWWTLQDAAGPRPGAPSDSKREALLTHPK